MLRKVFVVIFCLVCLASCQNKPNPQATQLAADLNNLLESENYFELKTKFESEGSILPEGVRLGYEALVDHYFNKHALSNQKIDQLLALADNNVSDTLMNIIYRAKLMNHINLYEYADAVSASNVLTTSYASFADSNDMRNLINENKIWSALSSTPKQEVIKNEDADIQLERDNVGLLNVNVVVGDQTVNFIFDTGANISVIVRSMAEKLGAEIIKSDFFVTAATGTEVACDLAVIPEMKINNITIKNAVFLVMEDENFSFPQIKYFPNGAVGFPIIQALGELHFKGSTNIFVPQNPVVKNYNNLALKSLTPVVAVKYGNDTLIFGFDTGAKTTTLFPLFYEKYKSYIDSNFTQETFKTGSAGGIIEFNGFIIDSLTFAVANSSAQLDSLRVHIEQFGENKKFVHGNFGQDYIQQFDEMVISFTNSYIEFK